MCVSEFSVVPPTRAEMMASLLETVGQPLASGCLSQPQDKPRDGRNDKRPLLYSSNTILAHWIKAVMLVIEVESDSSSVGDDTIIAINLTRQIEDVDDVPKDLLEKAQAASRTGIAFRHFIGGPCCQDKAFAMIPLRSTDLVEIEKLKDVRVIGKQGGLWVGSNISTNCPLAISDHNQFHDPSTRNDLFCKYILGRC